MPRQIMVADPSCPYHISARSNNRDWFALPTAQVWEITGRYLYFLHHVFEVRILAFVLMSNHFHLLARFPLANISEVMQYFMRETSRCISFESNRINHVYGNRFFRSRIVGYHYFTHAYKNIHRHPFEAALS